MAKIIAVANQKGGVGKTTTTVNLAACVAARGKSVLCVDIDPQGNTTSGLGVDKDTPKYSIYDVLINGVPARDALTGTVAERVMILPARKELSGAEVELVNVLAREKVLKGALDTLRGDFDYVFIDCPPSLDLLTLNSLCAADTVLVPIQCEFFALEGLSELMNTVRNVKRMYNKYLDIEGVLLTMYDGRLNLTMQVVAEVKRFFPGKVFKATIPRNVRISEAPSYGEPVNKYDPSSKGAAAYNELAAEFMENNEKTAR